MADVILKSRDLEIKVWDGQEVVNIKPSTAFNEDFIQECRTAGVKDKAVEIPVDKSEE